MRYVVVSIYDRAVGAYSRPAYVRSEGEAIRVFSDEVNKSGGDNPMAAHPDHFTLFFLGHFDDEFGKFSAPSSGSPTELVSAERIRVSS